MQLLLLTVGLTLLSVAPAEERDLMIHAAAYRDSLFPATVDKVREPREC